MPHSLRVPLSDSARDARRYHNLLLALTGAIETIRTLEQTGLDVDTVLGQMLPDLAVALGAQHAFVALQHADDGTGTRSFEITAAWPQTELIGKRILSSPVLDELVDTGQVKVIDPLGEPDPPGIKGLEIFQAVSVVLATMQTAAQLRIVGICNQRNADLGPYLAADGMALASIVELVALGVRAGERRRRELDGIQETSSALLTVLELQQVLSIIVERAARVFDAPATSVMLWDRMRQSMVVRDSWGLPSAYSEKHHLPARVIEITERLREHSTSLTADVLRQCPVGDEHLLESGGLYEVLRTPLTMKGELIGYLSIYDRNGQRSFTREEIELTNIFASQAAFAVHRAELYEAIKRRNQHWQALHEASKAVVTGFAGDRKAILDRIVAQAVESISCAHGPKANFGVIQLYDDTAMELSFESVYPTSALAQLRRQLGDRRAIGPSVSSRMRIGITGRTALTGQAQRVDSVVDDPDYVGVNPSTRSELSVPLLDNGRIMGVLSLESDELAAFDEDDEMALRGLAEMAVIVMKNQAQTEQLNRTHALALMGAWGADIAHDVIHEVGAIRRAVYLLRQQPELAPNIHAKLVQIDEAAETLFLLHQLPQGPALPGSKLEQLVPLSRLDNVISQEIEDLQRKHPDVDFRYEAQKRGLSVRMHEQWLRRVLRHLLHNAIAALADLPPHRPRRIVIRTSRVGAMVEINVQDTGVGVPAEVQPLLFSQPIPRSDGTQGRGLLLVRFILEQHGGTARLVWSDHGEGSCFAFQLPSGSGQRTATR